MTRGTTICCSAFALLTTIALAKPAAEPPAIVPLRPVWTLALNSRLTAPPAFDRTVGFFAIEEDRLVAYDLISGSQSWLVETRPLFQPVAYGELLFVTEAAALAALHAADGSVAWKVPLETSFAGRPSAGGGWVIGGAADGTVTAIRAADGKIAWKRDVGSKPHASPLIADDRVYLPLADGRIVALKLDDGEPIWERRVGGSPNEIIASGDRLYAGSTDNFFYCLMVKDGRIDWRWRTGADVIGAAAADDHRVYFVSLDNVLRALNRVSGGQAWIRALPLRPTSGPLLVGASLVVAGQAATIRTFAAKDGAPTLDIAAGDDVVAPPWSLPQPVTGLPMVVVVTRNVVRGDTVSLSVRSIEPVPAPVGPLPNAVMPAPMPAPPSRP